MSKDALFYPQIGFSDPAFVKALALFYDRVYRIVPNGTVPNDHSDLAPLLEEGLIGSMVDPVGYASEAADEFLEGLDRWEAIALMHGEEGEGHIARIHKDKTDQRIHQLFDESGFRRDSDWMYVPNELAANYMLYLATAISRRNSLSLVTGEWGAWTGSSYFQLDGKLDEFMTPETELCNLDVPFSLFSLIISETVPLNIAEIPTEKILQFRERRRDEIKRFRRAIYDLREDLSGLDAEEIRVDRITDKVCELNRAIDDYKRSAVDINVKNWFGVSMMGFPAPVVFGELFSIPTASTIVLGASGLALGGLFSLNSNRNDLRKLKAEHQASYLVDLKRHFRKYTTVRGGGDINYHAWNCMEEYVCD